MARILAISSQVVSGHVGLSAMLPALQRKRHEVLALPTILLSNHPGRQAASGTRIDPQALSKILQTLDANGRLDGIDAILTGYLPSAEHVAIAATAIARCRARNPQVLVLCDPVLGDDPKGLYIDVAAAAAIRDQLLPLAAIVTPNRFELAWLTDQVVADAASAVTVARTLKRQAVIATSVPSPPERLSTIAVTAEASFEQSVKLRLDVPNGTGDLLAALFVSAYLASGDIEAALIASTTELDTVIAASIGHAELQLQMLGDLCPPTR